MPSTTHSPQPQPNITYGEDEALTPHAAVVDVPDDLQWITSPAGDVAVDSVVRHPDTAEPVRVIAIRDVTITDPVGDGPYWQRGAVPARQFTLAPDRSYPKNVDFTVPTDAVLTRLDRLYSDLDATHAHSPGSRPLPPSRARRHDQVPRQERLQQFHATLTEQVLSLTSSQAWTDWLRTAARFHHYSFRNTIAIWMQRPDATHVAGYRTWQTLGRHVRKGEQGIQILAPVTRQAEQRDPEPTESAGPGRPQMSPPRANGQEQAHDDPGPRQMVGVRIAHVFDISQTDGKPLTDCGAVRPTLLTGQAPQYLWDGLAVQVTEAGYHLADEHLGNGANGRTDYSTRQVLIRPGLDPAQRVKTLAHELGHVMLHEPQDLTNPAVTVACRGRKEVEAESIAFLVTSAHGIDSAQYSFPYLAGWAQQTNHVEETLSDTAAHALTTAHRILDRLDRNNPAPLITAAGDNLPGIVPAPRASPAHVPRAAIMPASTPDVGMSR